jgi:uncharacterized protein YjbI with pentapeptide repeats
MFTRNQMEKVNFSSALLKLSLFHGASMQKANLSGVQAEGTQFVDADLSYADCHASQMNQSIWINACVSLTNFTGCQLVQAQFSKSRAQGALFIDSQLVYANFSYADVSYADFSGANFNQTQFHRAVQQETRWGDQTGVLANDPELFAAESWSEQLYHSDHA